MCDSAQYGYACPMTLEEFLLDTWGNGFSDWSGGDVDEVGWHVFGVEMETGGFFLTTTHTGSTSITEATTNEEYAQEIATIEAELDRFYDPTTGV